MAVANPKTRPDLTLNRVASKASVSGLALSHDFLLQREAIVRQFARRVVYHKTFEAAVLLCVVATVLGMAFEDVPSRRSGVSTTGNYIVDVVDSVALAVFSLEFVLRVLANGLMPLPGWAPKLLQPDKPIVLPRSLPRTFSTFSGRYFATTPTSGRGYLATPTPTAASSPLLSSPVACDADEGSESPALPKPSASYYFASSWNRLDFLLLCISALAVFSDLSTLSSLRALRALRPLRMIQFITSLQVLLKSIWRAVGTLVDVFVCLGFMYLFFALFGQQLFQGVLRQRCVIPQGDDAVQRNITELGFDAVSAIETPPVNYTLYMPERFCSMSGTAGSFHCSYLGVYPTVEVSGALATVPLVCTNVNRNPNSGFVSFDALHSAVWTVFMMSSLEGWTNTMYALMDADVAPVAAIFCVSVVVVISFLGLQLFTSTLCTSSLQARIEEAIRIKNELALKHAEKRLWAERSRLRMNAKAAARIWRRNAHKRTVMKKASQMQLSCGSKASMSVLQCGLDTGRSRGSSQWVNQSSHGHSGGVGASTTSALGLSSDFRFNRNETSGLSESVPSCLDAAGTVSAHPTIPNVPRVRSALALQQGSMRRIVADATEEGGYRPLISTHTMRELNGREPDFESRSTLDEHASSVSGVSEHVSEAATVLLVDTPSRSERAPAPSVVPLRPGRFIRLAPLNLPSKRSSLKHAPVLANLAALPTEELVSNVGDPDETQSPASDSLVPTPHRVAATGPVKSFFGFKGNSHKVVPILTEDESFTPTKSAIPSKLLLTQATTAGFSGSTKTLQASGPSKRINLVKLSKGGRTERKLARIVGMFGANSRVLPSLAGGLSPSSRDGNGAATLAQAAKHCWMQCRLRTWLLVLWTALCRLAVPICSRCECLMKARWFDRFIVFCIVCNAISISSYYHGLSEQHESALQILEFGFSLIFTFEMVVKMFGLRSLKVYFSEKQNVFDFVVVVTSSPSILSPMIAGSIGHGSSLGSLSAFRVFRLFRVFRVARLLHKVQSLRKLLAAVTGSMTSLLNLLFFMLFTLVTLAIVTKDLFARSLPLTPDARFDVDRHGFSRYATGDLPRFNYDDFFSSFLSLFIIMSGENWTEFYYYTGLTHNAVLSTVVQILYFILSNYVLISMFVAIIIQNFEADDAEREQQQRNAYSQIRTAITRRASQVAHSRRKFSLSGVMSNLTAGIKRAARKSVVVPVDTEDKPANVTARRRRWSSVGYPTHDGASLVTDAAKQRIAPASLTDPLKPLSSTLKPASEASRDAVRRGRRMSAGPVLQFSEQRRRSRHCATALRDDSVVPKQQAGSGLPVESVVLLPSRNLEPFPTASIPEATVEVAGTDEEIPVSADDKDRLTDKQEELARKAVTKFKDMIARKRALEFALGIATVHPRQDLSAPRVERRRSALQKPPTLKHFLTEEYLLEEAQKVGSAADVANTSLNAEDKAVMEGVSWGWFSVESPIRGFCFEVMSSRWFDWTIMACIVASGISMAVQAGPQSGTTGVNALDVVFNTVFFVEFVIKSIALGVYGTGKHAYLRNGWNVSDLIILTGSFTSMVVDSVSSSGQLSFLRVFRLGRALRPLRVIRGNANMRVVVSSLMSSITDVVNVYFLTQFVSLIFAIMGVSLFSGLFYRCNNPTASSRAECTGWFLDPRTGVNTSAVWANPTYASVPGDPPFNFDDVANAFLLVKEVQVTEGWTEVLAAGMDTTSDGLQPRFNATKWNALYFIAVITIGTFFVSQLYTGVIVQSYSKSAGTAFMTPEQRKWIVTKMQIAKHKPQIVGDNAHVWWLKRLAQDILIPCKSTDGATCKRGYHRVHNKIETAVSVAVLGNMVVLMLYRHGMSDAYASTLDALNNAFLVLFAVEMCAKMFALGVRKYWREPSFAFDGAIVLGSGVVLLLSAQPALSQLSFIPQVARLFRVGRLLRLLQKFPRLRKLFETIISALPSMGNVTALLLLVLFVETIIAIELFGNVLPSENGAGISEHANFRSFWSGFLLLFRGLTGENINVVSRNCMRYHAFAPVYFILFNDLVKSVFLNLYLATIIDKLDMTVTSKPRLFQQDFEHFESVWLQYDKDATGWIDSKLLRSFLRRLRPPLGGPQDPKEFTRWYLSMFPAISKNVKNGKVRYKDLLLSLSMLAVDASHLLVGERVHRDVLAQVGEKSICALRIQCAFRSYKTRKLFEQLRGLARSRLQQSSFCQLENTYQSTAQGASDLAFLTAVASHGSVRQFSALSQQLQAPQPSEL